VKDAGSGREGQATAVSSAAKESNRDEGQRKWSKQPNRLPENT
jgi:hypothetical protein